MECELSHWHEVHNDAGDLTYTVVLGRVKRFHVVSGSLDVLMSRKRPSSTPRMGLRSTRGSSSLFRGLVESRMGGRLRELHRGRADTSGYEIMRIPWNPK